MYSITTLCYGPKYSSIKPYWLQRTQKFSPNANIMIFNEPYLLDASFIPGYNGYLWATRWKQNMDILEKTGEPVVMCDVDVIIEKDIGPLVNLPYDIIISKEIGGDGAYPKECSMQLGFGVCAGFTILKPSAQIFMREIYENMCFRKYKTYDDQVNIMKFIVNHSYALHNEKIILDGKTYNNKIISLHGLNIRICVLDFDIITRDPINNKGQFANHINIDNVGGCFNFIQYFYNDLETLPLTCRCGKMGDKTRCVHINKRKKQNEPF